MKRAHVLALALLCVLLLLQTDAAPVVWTAMIAAAAYFFSLAQSSPDVFKPAIELQKVFGKNAGGGVVGGAFSSLHAIGSLLVGAATASVNQEPHADFLHMGMLTFVYCTGHIWFGWAGRWRYVGPFDGGISQIRPVDILFVWLSASP